MSQRHDVPFEPFFRLGHGNKQGGWCTHATVTTPLSLFASQKYARINARRQENGANDD